MGNLHNVQITSPHEITHNHVLTIYNSQKPLENCTKWYFYDVDCHFLRQVYYPLFCRHRMVAMPAEHMSKQNIEAIATSTATNLSFL